MAWLQAGRLRWVLAAVVLVALVAATIVAWPYVQLYTGSAPPAQFYQQVRPDPALAHDYPRVLGVAHNAGNNLGTLATAERYGADVIEIDVISARGQLVAGRDQPWPWLARRLFRGPTLAQAWDRAAAAGSVKLDLNQTDHGFLDDLVAFVAPRARSRRVMISSTDPGALLYLHRRLPMSPCCSAWPDPMPSTSCSPTPCSRGPSAEYRSSRACGREPTTWPSSGPSGDRRPARRLPLPNDTVSCAAGSVPGWAGRRWSPAR
jgi:hypothetical protein